MCRACMDAARFHWHLGEHKQDWTTFQAGMFWAGMVAAVAAALLILAWWGARVDAAEDAAEKCAHAQKLNQVWMHDMMAADTEWFPR